MFGNVTAKEGLHLVGGIEEEGLADGVHLLPAVAPQQLLLQIGAELSLDIDT